MNTGNRLKAIRTQRSIAAVRLAEQVGVSRQTIYAIEDGSFVPNTIIALKLARILAVSVEDLFRLPDEPQVSAKTWGAIQPNEFVRLIHSPEGPIALPANSAFSYLPATNGIAGGTAAGRKQIKTFGDDIPSALSLAGCDPGLSLLEEAAGEAGVNLCLVPASSEQALKWLHKSQVQIAGSHLLDPNTGQYNLPMVQQSFAAHAVHVITFANWQTGLMMRPGDAERVRSIADLASPAVTIVNREKGSGSRAQFDRALEQAHLPANQVKGYARVVNGHLAGARAVADGWADCCYATESAARCYGLHFVPLQIERFDLVFPEHVLQTREGQILLNLLNSARLRNKLGAIAGYETSESGRQVA